MQVGVISDTHLSGMLIPDHIVGALEGVDLILHAGDILEMAVIEQLSGLAETIAVRGNMDHEEVNRALPDSRVIEVGGFRIGMTHGYGPPSGLVSRVAAEFDSVECVIFGHTHSASVEKINGVLYFNPGTPTDKRFATENTLGILEITDVLKPRIIRLE